MRHIAGQLGVDLSRGAFVRLELSGQPDAYRIDLQIGFRETAKLHCRALAAGVVAAEATASGGGDEIVKVALEADQISVIEIQGGPALLVELCAFPIDSRVPGGWHAVPGFQYPLYLPVAHADYPCPSKPASPAAAQTLALGRISYGGPEPWEPEFPSLHATLVELIEGGPPPSGEAMHTRSKEVLISGGNDSAPQRHRQHPVEMAVGPQSAQGVNSCISKLGVAAKMGHRWGTFLLL